MHHTSGRARPLERLLTPLALAASLALVPRPGRAATYTLHAEDVPVVTDDWLNEANAEGAPESDCNNAAFYATNDVGTSADYMVATVWTPLALAANEAIVKVEVDVNGRFDTSTSNNQFRIRVGNTVPTTAMSTPVWSQNGTDDVCRWRWNTGGPGWDITSLRSSWTVADVAGLHVAVRRFDNTDPNPPKRARVNSFRVVVTTAVCSVSPEKLDFGQVAIGTAVEKMFQITNTGSGAITGTLTAACGAPFAVIFPPVPYNYFLNPGATQDVWVRYTSANGIHNCTLPLGASGILCDSVSLEGCDARSFELAFNATVTQINDPQNVLRGTYVLSDALSGTLEQRTVLTDEDPAPDVALYHSTAGYSHIAFGRTPDVRLAASDGAMTIGVWNNDPVRGDVVELTATNPGAIEGLGDVRVTSIQVVLADPSMQALPSTFWPQGVFNLAAWPSARLYLYATSLATGAPASLSATITSANPVTPDCLSSRGRAGVTDTPLKARILTVEDPYNLLQGAARVGNFAIGTYALQSDPADSNTDPSVGEYHWTSPLSFVQLMLDGLLFASDAHSTLISVFATDRPHQAGQDGYDLLSTINLRPRTGLQNDYFRWTATNAQGTADEGTGPFAIRDLTRYESNVLDLRGYDESNPGRTYRVTAKVTTVGSAQTVDAGSDLRVTSVVSQAAPNPFFGITRLRLRACAGCGSDVRVYSVDGRLVRVLPATESQGGLLEAVWDGKSASGGKLAAGRYFYRFGSGPGMQAGSFVLLHGATGR